MERIVTFEPAYDKRSTIPGKNYGIHGVEILFLLKGDRGAVQFRLYTNWQLPHVQAETAKQPLNRRDPHVFCRPRPTDLGYHSPVPRYEDQTMLTEDCQHIGGPCYYDGSSLNAYPVFDRLLAEGDKGVWEALEAYYHSTFEETECTILESEN
jgi:hypothetical protein